MSHGMDTGGTWSDPPTRYGWSPPPGPAQGETLRYAGWWRRVGATAVDGVLGVLLLVPGAVYFVAGPSELVNCEGLNILESSPGMCDRPTEVIPLDLLWPLWDRQKQTLHDKISSTVVLRI
jgi:uncharacterized RDD family membrane protein YckC